MTLSVVVAVGSELKVHADVAAVVVGGKPASFNILDHRPSNSSFPAIKRGIAWLPPSVVIGFWIPPIVSSLHEL